MLCTHFPVTIHITRRIISTFCGVTESPPCSASQLVIISSPKRSRIYRMQPLKAVDLHHCTVQLMELSWHAVIHVLLSPYALPGGWSAHFRVTESPPCSGSHLVAISSPKRSMVYHSHWSQLNLIVHGYFQVLIKMKALKCKTLGEMD